MEASNTPKVQKSTTGLEQSEGDTDFFFYYWGVVHHEYAPLGQTVMKNTTKKSSIIFVMQFDAGDQRGGTHATGSCIMTMPQLIHHT
jgi:hypothetical protein